MVTVGDIKGCRVECAVLEYRQDLVFRTELAEVDAPLLIVQLLDVSVEPDVLPTDRGDSLALQLDLGDREFCDQVAPGGLSLYAQG